MQTGQQFGGLGEGVRFDSQVQEGNAGSEHASTEGNVILGVVSIGSHDTIEAGGRRCGYVMGLVDLTGKKYYVDISESTYRDIVDVYVAAIQRYEAEEHQAPASSVGSDPTGSPEEINRMRSMLEQSTPTDAMRKLGFISDDDASQSRTADPVDDILAMVSDEGDYEDPGEESFQEDVEGL
jgi:hypothetical protein